MIECLALILSLCLNESSNAEISISPGWTGAEVILSDGSIVIQNSADAVVYGDPKKLHSACEGACLYYAKRCTENNQLYRCSIYFTSELMRPLQVLHIDAAGPSQNTSIQERISLCSNEKCFKISRLVETCAAENFPPFRYDRRSAP